MSYKEPICILQNAWGDRELPIVFYPNWGNKSSKTIQKVTRGERFLFCNTTNKVAPNASGKFPPDPIHFDKVLKYIEQIKYRLSAIIICGEQAKKFCLGEFKERLFSFQLAVIVMPHPAARNLSNKEIRWVRFYFDNFNKKEVKNKVEKFNAISGRIQLIN